MWQFRVTYELLRHVFRGHDDEVLDVTFDYTGQYIATCSADGTGRVYNSTSHQCICKLEGHEGEISKVRWLWSSTLVDLFLVTVFNSCFKNNFQRTCLIILWWLPLKSKFVWVIASWAILVNLNNGRT